MDDIYKSKPIVINTGMAQKIGLNEAIVFQQLYYWLTMTKSGVYYDGQRWIYNTYDEWRIQFPFWSADTIKRTLTALKKRGLIRVEQLNKNKHDRTNYYTIDFDAYNALESPVREDEFALFDETQNKSIEQGNLPLSNSGDCTDLTEITTEITTESSSKTPVPPKGGTSAPYPEEFETLWKTYPKREGQNSKKAAFKAWKARVRSGVDPELLYDATQRYGQYCRAKGLIGTDKVKMAATFYGPNEHYLEPWTVNHAPQQGASMHNFDGAVYEQPPLPDWTE